VKAAARTIGADPALTDTARRPALPHRRGTEDRPRFDASARAAAEPLLLALLRSLCALAAVLTVQAVVDHLGAVWPHPRLWAALVPAAVLMLPHGARHQLNAPRVNTILRLVRELPGNIAVPLGLQALLWIGGLSPLPAATLFTLLVTQLVYVEFAHAVLLSSSWRWRQRARIVVVGADAQGVAAAEMLRRDDRHTQVVGFVDDRLDRVDPHLLPAPFLGSPSALIGKGSTIDGVVIALPSTASQRVDTLALMLRDEKIDNIYLAPDATLMRRLACGPRAGLGTLVLLGAPALPLPGRVAKRLFDMAFAALALICFLPL
jgi:FlaA1/EpsC-like NDP-sugar epimerase